MSAVIIDDWDVSCVADTCCAGGGSGEFNADFAYAGGSLICSTKWSSSAPHSGCFYGPFYSLLWCLRSVKTCKRAGQKLAPDVDRTFFSAFHRLKFYRSVRRPRGRRARRRSTSNGAAQFITAGPTFLSGLRLAVAAFDVRADARRRTEWPC